VLTAKNPSHIKITASAIDAKTESGFIFFDDMKIMNVYTNAATIIRAGIINDESPKGINTATDADDAGENHVSIVAEPERLNKAQESINTPEKIPEKAKAFLPEIERYKIPISISGAKRSPPYFPERILFGEIANKDAITSVKKNETDEIIRNIRKSCLCVNSSAGTFLIYLKIKLPIKFLAPIIANKSPAKAKRRVETLMYISFPERTDKNPLEEKPSVPTGKTTENTILKTMKRISPIPADEKKAVAESFPVLFEIIIARKARTPVTNMPIAPSQNHKRSESVIPIKT
jgi:hypothetical protein